MVSCSQLHQRVFFSTLKLLFPPHWSPGLLTGVIINTQGLWNDPEQQRGKDSGWLDVEIFWWVFLLFVFFLIDESREQQLVCWDGAASSAEIYWALLTSRGKTWGIKDDVADEPSWLLIFPFPPTRPTCTQWASYTETWTLTTAWSNW